MLKVPSDLPSLARNLVTLLLLALAAQMLTPSNATPTGPPPAERVTYCTVVRRQITQAFRNLRDYFGWLSVFAANPRHDGRDTQEFGQLRQGTNSGFQPVHWIGLAEFDDPGLEVGKKDDRVLGDDP